MSIYWNLFLQQTTANSLILKHKRNVSEKYTSSNIVFSYLDQLKL